MVAPHDFLALNDIFEFTLRGTELKTKAKHPTKVHSKMYKANIDLNFHWILEATPHDSHIWQL